MINVTDLKKTYPGHVPVKALKGVSFNVQQGEFIAIMGPSGSGKSTLLHQLALLDEPTSGKILLDGLDISTLSDRKRTEFRLRHLGYVFQEYALIPELNAIENAFLPLMLLGARKRDYIKATTDLMIKVGLGDRLKHLISQLSGGEQQRVAIARSLVNNPVLILADEPTGNLDTRTSFEIMELFQDLNEKGRTIVYVTHETDIAKFATRNVMFRDGKISRENFVTDRLNAREILKTLPVEAIEEFDK